ncbi:hypothetical protein TDB9533_02523 [Thalassocella blandensis]|nr:hypothetical protein TDB9533_02523 [Thalassocella blandensis]
MSTSIKVLSINIHKGFSYFNRRFVLPELREALRSTETEIVFLQEVLGEHTDWAEKHKLHWPGVSQYEYLADSLWPEMAYGKNAVYPQGHHGNALLSKQAIAQWHNEDISLSGIEKRGVLYAKIDVGEPAAPLHLLCTHLSLREGHRQQQLHKILKILNAIPPDEAVVLAGDFNDWRLKVHQMCCANGLIEVHEGSQGKPAKTFPALLPVLRLDRIYVRNLKVKHAEVLKGRLWSHLSDHRPLYAELELM